MRRRKNKTKSKKKIKIRKNQIQMVRKSRVMQMVIKKIETSKKINKNKKTIIQMKINKGIIQQKI